MKRFFITETSNGFILKTEWDCFEEGIDDMTEVFEAEDGDLLGAFDEMVKKIRDNFED